MAKATIKVLQKKETLQPLAKKYGVAPSKIEEWKEIVDTNQGSQYTTADWESLLRRNGIHISMDGQRPLQGQYLD